MNRIALVGLSLLAATAVGCSDDDPSGTGGTGGGASSTGTPGSGGDGGAGATGGTGPTGGTGGGTGATGGGGSECTAALEEALGPVDTVSEDEIIAEAVVAGVREVFIDATAGGFMPPMPHPAIYLKLSDATKVEVSDTDSFASNDWDLAFKRYVIRSNSGDGGPGNAGAAFISNKDFAAVTLADAQAAMLDIETWFDDDCNYETDATNNLVTTFSSWYAYEGMVLEPLPGTWVVRGADGTSFFKLEFLTYYADPNGGENPAISARIRVNLAALQ